MSALFRDCARTKPVRAKRSGTAISYREACGRWRRMRCHMRSAGPSPTRSHDICRRKARSAARKRAKLSRGVAQSKSQRRGERSLPRSRLRSPVSSLQTGKHSLLALPSPKYDFPGAEPAKERNTAIRLSNRETHEVLPNAKDPTAECVVVCASATFVMRRRAYVRGGLGRRRHLGEKRSFRRAAMILRCIGHAAVLDHGPCRTSPIRRFSCR